jgi:hypothetical protein
MLSSSEPWEVNFFNFFIFIVYFLAILLLSIIALFRKLKAHKDYLTFKKLD